MNIVIFSTNASTFNLQDYQIQQVPSASSLWQKAISSYPQHSFTIVTQLPAMFLLDIYKDSVECAPNAKYILSNANNAFDFSQELITLKPDLAIAASFWTAPYDWLGLQDAMISNILNEHGIKTYSHSQETQLICFDKYATHQFLEKLFLPQSFIPCPKYVYVPYSCWYRAI